MVIISLRGVKYGTPIFVSKNNQMEVSLMLLKSLQGTQEQLDYYYNKWQQDKDNELIKFMYESYKRQYLAELDTFKFLQGGEQQ